MQLSCIFDVENIWTKSEFFGQRQENVWAKKFF